MQWFQLVQAIIAGKQVAPSWGAWAGLLVWLPLMFLVYDRIWGRGKHESQMESDIKQLCKDFEEFKKEDFGEFKQTVGIMDTHLKTLSTNVRDLTNEWRGIDGQNGGRSKIRELTTRVSAIEKRNDEIDAITRYEREQMQKLGRNPERVRDKLQDE